MADQQSGSQDFATIVGAIGDLFGGTLDVKGTTTGTATSETLATLSGEKRRRLELDPAAITRIIEEVLSGPEGLASIFAGEQTAGIFNSSVAAQAAGNLTAKLVGELAKLTAEEITTQEQEQTSRTIQEQRQTTRTTQEDEGILSGIGDFIKGIF